MPTTETSDTLRRIEDRIEKLAAGEAIVRRVEHRFGQIDDREVVVFEIVLADPQGETWPVTDVSLLYDHIDEIIAHEDRSLSWTASFQPEHPEELEDEDADPEEF